MMVLSCRIWYGLLVASKQHHGCCLKQRQLLTSLVSLIPRHQWAYPRRRCCGCLSVAPTRASLTRCGFGIWRMKLCLKEIVLPSPLRLFHPIPIDEASAVSSILRIICILRCHLASDRVLHCSYVRPVQRLSAPREVPLDVAQFNVRSGIAHDTGKFRSNVLIPTIQNQGASYGESDVCQPKFVHAGRLYRVTPLHEGLMIHGFHHPMTMTRAFLERSTTCTKRACLDPALLALLLLRRLDAAILV